MALIAFDSCTRYSPGYDLAYAYTVSGTIAGDATGLYLSGNSSFYNRIAVAFDTIRIGIKLVYPENQNSQMTVFRILMGTIVVGRLDVSSGGLLYWYSHASSTSSTYLRAQSTKSITKGVEQVFDIYVRARNTAVGWVIVNVGASKFIDSRYIITTADNGGTGYNLCFIGTSSYQLKLKGFHVSSEMYSATISPMYNAWTIERLVPVGYGSENSFYANPNTLENWECVDDVGYSADNDFISSHSLSNELFDVTTATVPNTNIAGVTLSGLATEESASQTYKLLIYSSGSEEVSSEFSGFTDYTYRQDRYVSVTDPNTGSAWTVSGVNSSEYGIKQTSLSIPTSTAAESEFVGLQATVTVT